MGTLREAVLRFEPRMDLLHDCLGFGRFAEVTVASDGFFLGRAPGDVGFNHFLGQPSRAAVDRTCQLFARLDEPHRQELIHAVEASGIPPRALGIPLNYSSQTRGVPCDPRQT